MNNFFNDAFTKVLVLAVLAAAVSITAAAQSPLTTDNDALRLNELRFHRSATNRSLGSVTAPNRLSYQIGKDFGFAISDSQGIDDSIDSVNYTIVNLVYLVDEMEGQAEALQLQKVLKSVVRGTMGAAEVSAQIDAISKAYLARLGVEQKWYFKVGSSQANLFIAGWAKDSVAIKQSVTELKALGKTAPRTTPQSIIDAINAMTKYSSKQTFDADEFAAILDDAKVISQALYA